MRPQGKFTYLLMDIKNGGFIAQVESNVEIKAGDELNFRGNKLIVKEKENDNKLLSVEKIGFAIIVN